jgi:ATP-dependent DNA ligase
LGPLELVGDFTASTGILHAMTDSWTPMLCRLAPSLPEGKGWAYEPKMDGFRGLLVRKDAEVRILSRNRRRLEPSFPDLVSTALELLPEHCALDGEIVAIREAKPDFSALLARLAGQVHTQSQFVAFDLLQLGEEDLTARPYSQRRSRLLDTVPDGHSRTCATVQTEDLDVAREWLDRARDFQIEGVVAKRLGEPYRCGRRSWVKVKHWNTVDLVVGGYTGTTDRLSLLLGGYDPAGSLTYVGQTVSLPPAATAQLVPFLKALTCDHSFGKGPTPGYSRWDSHRFEEWIPLRPLLVCEVAFSRLDGHFLRHSARFVRWRPDKMPAACTLQDLGSAPKTPAA